MILPGSILLGGDYNPEQWPEEVWHEDMRLMKLARVNFVTVAVFSWAKLQSAPGRFHFEWLDRLMDLLAANGIGADLATATATPPPWLTRLHPEMLPVTAQGTTLWPGSRQQYNPSSRAYREACTELVTAMATRYKGHPALAAWHVNNEYGCHAHSDYSDESAAAFREWLRKRHGTLEVLNDQWGTAFWGQHYYDWIEVLPPRETPTFPNPGQSMDWMRFCSDAMLECFLNEARILREITPGIPITTNFVSWIKSIDFRKWARHLDFVSWDAYPEPLGDNHDLAFTNDFMRSLKDGLPFALMEQVTTQVNWRPRNPLKPPGVMRLWSLQTVAQGGDLIGFFQWRQSRAGAEKYHGAIVGHSGSEEARAFREVAGLGSELVKLAPVVDARIAAEVAIYQDTESWWALEMPSKPWPENQYLEQLRRFHAPLVDANIPVDFVFADSDLSKYKLILAPACYLVQPGLGEKFEQFVAAGGVLVLTFFSGIVDTSDRVLLGGYPAPFRKVLGVEVLEWNPLMPEGTNSMSVFGETYTVRNWTEIVRADDAEVVATFEGDWFAGGPALTRNRFGKGEAWYLATQVEEGFYADFLATVCAGAAIHPAIKAPAGVQAIVRENASGKFLFLLNHTTDGVEFSDESIVGKNLLTGLDVTGSVTLSSRDVAVLKLCGVSADLGRKL